MEKVADDSNYMQQNWNEGEMLQGSDDLQEILAQFESTAYLKDLNLFGGPMDPNGAGDKSKVDPVLSLPDVAFFHHLNDEEKQRHKRKLLNASGGGDPKDPPTKKGKIVVVEEQIESLTEGELAKRRESHNATERRRREKINEKIDELRKLLPGGGKGVNKAAVLHQTAERMKSLQLLFNRLVNEKRRLESSRNEPLEDVYRLRTALAHYQQQHPAASFGVGGPSSLPSLPPHAHPQTNILSQMPSPPTSNQQSNAQPAPTPLSVLPSHISHQSLKM